MNTSTGNPSGDKPLKLSSTFQSINSILWQLPAASIAISALLFNAAYNIATGNDQIIFGLSSSFLLHFILLSSAVFMGGMSYIVYRTRLYQAAATLGPPLPIGRGYANIIFQLATVLMSASFAGLAASSFWAKYNDPSATPFVLSLVGGMMVALLIERLHKSKRDKINKELRGTPTE